VLRYRSLAAGTLFSMALGMGLYGTVFIVPIFAQSQLGYTATQTGMLMLPGALASAMTMALLGRVVSRIDPRLLITVGGVLMVVTMLQLAAINPDTGEPSLYWPLIFRGSTTVLMFLPLSLASLGPLPRNEVGAGSGLFNLSRQLGGSFGIALLTVVLDRQRAVHRAQLVEHLASTNPLLQERLHSLQIWLSQRAAGTVQPEGQVLHLLSQQVDRQATLLAYGDVFRTLAGVFLVVLPLVLLLGRPPSAVKAPP